MEVERRVRIELEDYLFDVVQDEYGAKLPIEKVDEVISLVWNLAVENKDTC